jgi:uncharacterized protein YpmS
MEKEFIPYEQALALKELGFSSPYPIGGYQGGAVFYYEKGNLYYDGRPMYSSDAHAGQIDAPLYQQAFRWFRDKYNLRGFIGFRPNVKQFDYHIYDMSLSGKEYVKQRTMEEFNKDPKVGTYEEAELECLKKLIEAVKNKQG